jgi:ATP-binding cassette subfamily B protein
MNLLYPLPEETRNILPLSSGEEIWYAIPYDLTAENRCLTDSYVVVTDHNLWITQSGRLLRSVALEDCTKVVFEPQTGCGLLTAEIHGHYELLARCSMKHFIRFSYVARGADMLVRKQFYKVESLEAETICPKCGRPLTTTGRCMHCQGSASSWKRFWSLCSNYTVRLILASLFMLFVSGANILGPKIQQTFIDNSLLSGNGTMKEVGQFVLSMLLITLVLIVMQVLKNWYCTSLGARMAMDIRKRLFAHLQSLSLTYIQDRKPGDLMNRITSDSVQIRRFMEVHFGNLCSTVLTMIFSLIYMLVIDWKLTLLSLILLPISFALSYWQRKNMRRRFSLQRKKNDKLNSSLQDVLSGIGVVKIFGREQAETDKFRSYSEEYAKVQKSNNVFFAYFTPLLNFVMGLGIYLVTYFSGLNVLKGTMTPGVLSQFIAYAGILYGPLEQLTNLPRQFAEMLTSLDRIYDVLDEEPAFGQNPDAKDITIQGEVEFRDVSFGYRSYEPILNNIDLKVKKGEMIGLVGASGTGKSTMINLLMHLYEVDSGALLIDGVDIKDIKLDSLRSQIGVVLQETFLFSGTILENIRYANPDATLEEVIQAAKAANAHDFICRAPDSYNTYIGDNGYTLSGGERQRIAIARAILNKPNLLILDEATSNLDTESEYLIQKALERLTNGKTTFAIAHRLSTLRNADRLVVIDRHRIAEIGTHDELIAQKGIYYNLVKTQLEMSKIS